MWHVINGESKPTCRRRHKTLSTSTTQEIERLIHDNELMPAECDSQNVYIHATDAVRLTQLLTKSLDNNYRRTVSILIITHTISAQLSATKNRFTLLPKQIYNFVLKELGSYHHHPYLKRDSPIDEIVNDIQHTPYLVECSHKYHSTS